MTFKVGDKIVVLFDVNGLKKGQIVTIKDLIEGGCRGHRTPNKEPKILLEEDSKYGGKVAECWHYGEGFAFEEYEPNWRERL